VLEKDYDYDITIANTKQVATNTIHCVGGTITGIIMTYYYGFIVSIVLFGLLDQLLLTNTTGITLDLRKKCILNLGTI
jgi:hypothetical protein